MLKKIVQAPLMRTFFVTNFYSNLQRANRTSVFHCVRISSLIRNSYSSIQPDPNQKSQESNDEKLVTSTSSAPSEESTTNLKVKPKKKSRRMYKHAHSIVMLRILATCREYLSMKPEEREKLTEESRFYYVRPEIDSLDLQGQKEFLAYIRTYNQLVYHTKEIKKANQATTEDGEKNKAPPEHRADFSKTTLKKFLNMDNNYECILILLVMKFLNPENKDLQDYLQEKKGNFDKKDQLNKGSKAGKKMRFTLTKNFDAFRMTYMDFLKYPDVECHSRGISEEYDE